jgi:hypothetical protein
MPRRSKTVHVRTDFAYDQFSRCFGHARDGVQMGNGLSERDTRLLDRGVQAGNAGIEAVDLSEQLRQDQAMDGLDAPLERLL